MIKTLGIHEEVEKYSLFTDLVYTINNSGLLPELERDTDLEHYIESLMSYSRQSLTVYIKDETSVAMCLIMEQNLNPHIRGSGIVVLLTLSYGNPKFLTDLIRYVKAKAKSLNKDWIALHHRTSAFEYRCKYFKLR